MGIFKRKSPEPEVADSALTFFTMSSASDFRAMVRDVFAEMGLEVTVHADHAVDDAGRIFGFWNVAAVCRDEPRRAWRRTIREHLQRVLASFDAPNPFDVLAPADVARQTFARLYEEASVPDIDLYPHREFAPGIVEMLALDLPETVPVFRREDATRFGGWDALRAHGVANLGRLEVEQLISLPVPGGGSFTALLGASVYTASRALLLPDLATELTGKRAHAELGWLMSVPNRHQVAWHIIEDHNVLTVINGMARFTAMGFSDSPGPVSQHVFWWNGTGYEQLTHTSEAGELTIQPSPAFQAVLDSIIDDRQR